MARRRFSQTSILKKLNAKCEMCHIPARAKGSDLTLHHKNRKSDDTNWQNIEILCRNCHSKREGTHKKKKDYR